MHATSGQAFGRKQRILRQTKGTSGAAKSLRLEGRARLKACLHEASVRVGREPRMPKRR